VAVRELERAVASDYDRGINEFPERLHVNALLFRWLWEHADLKARWAQWAIEQVERWPDASEPSDVETALDVFRSVLEHTGASETTSQQDVRANGDDHRIT
jgi:PadR family transcriptional regulator AphA